ncbi:MAG: ATP-binding protein [OCS116 cluster bacterium]|nr:ATP-binding protein [OCS116 cluster bacterium]
MGDELKRLSALEAAILILSAYYHDIGMVFTDEEREKLQNEDEFKEFENKYPEVTVSRHKNQCVTVDIAEWYCRWAHPNRVGKFVNKADANLFKWGNAPISEAIINVCRSHGQATDFLNNDTLFKVDFRTGTDKNSTADLRFCAILLRIADILDFDNSRSPEEIYKYLGLIKRDTNRSSASDVEWLKHLSSGGFSFPPERQGRYPITIIAHPDRPAVENDLREFLKIIEQELNKSAAMVNKCSPKWRDFLLPGQIDKSDIQSVGYKFGDYRFSLEQHEVLNLLMGDNLYDDHYVFIRELLQNAIDTVRHRQFYEQQNGQTCYFEPKITVTQWQDADNYQWIRIDDNGMGMTEDIVANYLLRIGKSYYNSAQFEAEKLSYKKTSGKDFTPVSRFGIGLLSCFIVGELVEVNTRYVKTDHGNSKNGIRMALSGLHGFFTTQIEGEGHSNPDPMPNHQNTNDELYKDQAGSSIAVRLDPVKADANFNLEKLLEKYIFCSPVPIYFEGKQIGGDRKQIIETPWLENIVEEILTPAETKQIEVAFKTTFKEPIKIIILPLDLTQFSPTIDFAGQLVIGYVAGEYNDFLSFGWNSEEGIYLAYDVERYLEGKIEVLETEFSDFQDLKSDSKIGREIKNLRTRLGRKKASDGLGRELIILNRFWKHFNQLNQCIDDFEDEVGESLISHNGVRVSLDLNANYFGKLGIGWFAHSSFKAGAITLGDHLRPDVSLSRDQLRNLTWQIHSTANLAITNALEATGYLLGDEPIDLFSDFLLADKELLFGRLIEDPYICIDGLWAEKAIISTDNGYTSYLEICKAVAVTNGTVTIDKQPPVGRAFIENFYDFCAAALVQLGCEIELQGLGRDAELFVVAVGQQPITDKLFTPLFFVEYENKQFLKTQNCPVNRDHPFSLWLRENAENLSRNYPPIFKSIVKFLSRRHTFRSRETQDVIKGINITLNRLRELDKDIAPPENLIIKESDFN